MILVMFAVMMLWTCYRGVDLFRSMIMYCSMLIFLFVSLLALQRVKHHGHKNRKQDPALFLGGISCAQHHSLWKHHHTDT